MKNTKKKIILLFIFIILFLLIAFGYFYFYPYKKISEKEVSFSYPKNFQIEKRQISSSIFLTYQIENIEISQYNRSYISVSIPTKNRKTKQKLIEYIEPQFHSLIKAFNLDRHEGEIVTYHLDRQLPGDRPVQAEITEIYLNSNYVNSPVMLTYYRYDSDHSLDKAWDIILKTFKY